MILKYTESYAGHTFAVTVEGHTGTVETSDGTEATHTLRLFLDTALELEQTGLTRAALPDAIAKGIAALKSTIDGTDDQELAAVLLPLGFVVSNQVSTPTSFAVVPGAAGEFTMSWDVVPAIDVYQFYLASAADFSDETLINSGDLVSPITRSSFTAGHYYLRMKAQKAGMDDSDYAFAEVDVA